MGEASCTGPASAGPGKSSAQEVSPVRTSGASSSPEIDTQKNARHHNSLLAMCFLSNKIHTHKLLFPMLNTWPCIAVTQHVVNCSCVTPFQTRLKLSVSLLSPK